MEKGLTKVTDKNETNIIQRESQHGLFNLGDAGSFASFINRKTNYKCAYLLSRGFVLFR
jgi:hypothetical protein